MPDETPEEKAAREAAAAAKPPAYLTMEQFDERLKARDDALLGALNNIVAGIRQPEREEPRREEVKPNEPLAITQDELLGDPTKAMERFFTAKVAPMMAQQGQPVDLEARVRIEAMNLQSRVKPEDWTKYSTHFQNVASKTDPRVLATPGGMDATWRLTKSYADDMIRDEEQKEHQRKEAANLAAGGKAPEAKSNVIDLADDEKDMAVRMGMSPEDYKKYGSAQEVEIGGGKKK